MLASMPFHKFALNLEERVASNCLYKTSYRAERPPTQIGLDQAICPFFSVTRT